MLVLAADFLESQVCENREAEAGADGELRPKKGRKGEEGKKRRPFHQSLSLTVMMTQKYTCV